MDCSVGIDFGSLTFARFRLTFRVEETARLPRYKCSIFRGGFGAAFRNVCCTAPKKDCPDCLLKAECSYSYLFETPNTLERTLLGAVSHAPHPFVLRPPLSSDETFNAGELFEAEIILIGKAIRHIPYVIYAFERFGSAGIGRSRAKFSLEAVHASVGAGWSEIYSKGTKTLVRFPWEKRGSDLVSGLPDKPIRELNIEIGTPLRIKFNGSLANSISFPIFLRNLLRRLSLLQEWHCEGDSVTNYSDLLEAANRVSTTIESLRWFDWTRYSARQKTELKMGGMLGKFSVKGDLTQFVPYLKLGEILHVGKGTSLGLGMYAVNFTSKQDV
jgi:hypothetical protein